MYYISCTHFRHGSYKVSLCIIKENGPFSECPIMTIAEKTRQLDPIFLHFLVWDSMNIVNENLKSDTIQAQLYK